MQLPWSKHGRVLFIKSSTLINPDDFLCQDREGVVLIRSEWQPTNITTFWFGYRLATTAHKYLVENSLNILANTFWYRSWQQEGSKLSKNCLSNVNLNFFHSGCSYPYVNKPAHRRFFYLNGSILCCLTSSRAHPTPHQWVKPRKHVQKSWSIKKKVTWTCFQGESHCDICV